MREWARYYVNFISEFFVNLWSFVKTIFNGFKKWLYNDIINYVNTLLKSSGNFTVIDWICFLLVFMINATFITFIVWRIVQGIIKRRRFLTNKKQKEDLLEEIDQLNYKIEELVLEKNQILGMRATNGLGAGMRKPSLIEEENVEIKKETVNSRFVKLIEVDKKYELENTNIVMKTHDMISLVALVERFINFSASQLHLYYTKEVVASFFAGLATSKIMILEGISGTGKTSLPYAMGKFFGHDSSIISVQPSWRDRAELLGYLNEFTKRFNETDFLKALYETTYRQDLNFIILDEMNLARIEYYFAEFLSIMEMPDANEWKIDVVPDSQASDPNNIINGKIKVPQNVWFIGTANRDDSTFTITDKVYDRSTIIEMNSKAKFNDSPFTEGITMTYEYLDGLFNEALATNALSTKTLDNVAKIDKFIADNLKVTFGNRIMKQLKTFVPVYVACGGTEIDGIDSFIARKVIRKFESLNLSFLHKELNDLIAFFDKVFGKGACKECINYIKDLIKNS